MGSWTKFWDSYLYLDKERIGDMAKPIEPTPVLKGKDAERFVEDMLHPKYDPKKEAFLRESIEVYKKHPF